MIEPTVYGVGINDADYPIKSTQVVDKTITIFECPYYKKWKDLLRRCYSGKFHEKHPTYIGCTVCEDWLTFSNFKAWMETQNWENKELDKDLLISGNRIYSPETCIFIDQRVNTFLSLSKRGEYLLGTRLKTDRNKFEARILDVNTNKRIHLGHFDNNNDAHKAWQHAKLEQLEIMMTEYTDERIKNSLTRIYNVLKFETENGQITTKLN